MNLVIDILLIMVLITLIGIEVIRLKTLLDKKR